MLAVWARKIQTDNAKYNVKYMVLCDKVEFGTSYAILSKGGYIVDGIPIWLLDTIQAV